MKIQGLLVAAVVLAALAGGLYWSNHHRASETTQVSADAPPKILTLSDADVGKIDLKKKDGDELLLAKNGDGKWQITAPKAVTADQAAVASLVSSMSSLTSERLVEEKAKDLALYGLASPALEVGLTEKSNKTHKLLIGDQAPASSGSYAKLDGDLRVFTIASYTRSSLEKGLNDLRDKRLLTVDSDKISRIELKANKQDIEFGRNKDQWQIVKPKPLRADSFQVDELVRRLSDARMDSTADLDEKKTAPLFAAAKPVATARVTSDSGMQELQVRKSKDDYYAKTSLMDGVYKISTDLGQGLDKKLDDFRNKKLFDFGYTDPKKVEIHDGPKAYFLSKGGDDWWSGDSKKLDATSAEGVISKLRDLQSEQFVDSGFTTPLITIAVTANDGKRVEKVLISKNGSNYTARRENEAVLYAVDSKAIDEIQRSARELKPATPSK